MAIENKLGVVPPSQGPLSSRYVDGQRKANAPKTPAGQWDSIFLLFHCREGKLDVYQSVFRLHTVSVSAAPCVYDQASDVVVVIIVIIIFSGSPDHG